MADYIEREEAIQYFKERSKDFIGHEPIPPALVIMGCANEVDAIPAADVVPVVRGRWVEHIEHDEETDCDVPYGFECSECGRWEQYKEPFCNCGAKMDGGQDDA